MRANDLELQALRQQIDYSTRVVAACLRRNQFIGAPITDSEADRRNQRDAAVRRELRKAKRAIRRLEEIVNA